MGTGTERERAQGWRREKRTQGGNVDGSDGAGTGTGVETRGRTQGGDGDDSGDENEGTSGDGDGVGDGKGDEKGEGRGEGGVLWYPQHQEISRVEDQALPFRTRHHFCRQEVAPAGGQQLRTQDPVPARRCRTEGRTGHLRQEGGNGDGNREGAGTGGRTSTGMSTSVGMRAREPGSLRSGNIGGSKDARGGATSRVNQQPQPQDTTPQ